MSPKFLPLNVRIKLLDTNDPQTNGRVTFMLAVPVQGKIGVVQANPGVMEIALIDPDDGKEKWYEVPFFTPEVPAILVAGPRTSKRERTN